LSTFLNKIDCLQKSGTIRIAEGNGKSKTSERGATRELSAMKLDPNYTGKHEATEAHARDDIAGNGAPAEATSVKPDEDVILIQLAVESIVSRKLMAERPQVTAEVDQRFDRLRNEFTTKLDCLGTTVNDERSARLKGFDDVATRVGSLESSLATAAEAQRKTQDVAEATTRKLADCDAEARRWQSALNGVEEASRDNHNRLDELLPLAQQLAGALRDDQAARQSTCNDLNTRLQVVEASLEKGHWVIAESARKIDEAINRQKADGKPIANAANTILEHDRRLEELAKGLVELADSLRATTTPLSVAVAALRTKLDELVHRQANSKLMAGAARCLRAIGSVARSALRRLLGRGHVR
jgi:chromosome segregation ATPase